MASYDIMENLRNTNQWLGSAAQVMANSPAAKMFPNPMAQWMGAWGQITERTFARMIVKPNWNIDSVDIDGTECPVEIETVISRPFGDLIHFSTPSRPKKAPSVLLMSPMSGHYATLLRSTVISLLPDCDVYLTDWHNARDIPVSEGDFDIEDYTIYLADFMRHLGSDLHVIAVCQPAPLALAATALLAGEDASLQPRTLTLIGGPIDPAAAETDVTNFSSRVSMAQLSEMALQRVGLQYAGAGRMVYPGLLQLVSFISMNGEHHKSAFNTQIERVADGTATDTDKHNKFYDEYLAVMDMSAEFYLSTVERIFKNREIARNEFTVGGVMVDIGKITATAVITVEGGNDDISAPGQCVAALELLTGLPDAKKASHLEPDTGHYGIFAGKAWRGNIRPRILDFIQSNE